MMLNGVFFISRLAACGLLAAALQLALLTHGLAQDPPKPQEKPKAEAEGKTAPPEKVPNVGAGAQEKNIPSVRLPSAEGPPKAGTTGAAYDAATSQMYSAELRKVETNGDWIRVLALRRNLIELARKNDNKEALADALLEYARAGQQSGLQAGTGISLDVVTKVYQEAIAIGTPAQRLLAQNNLGALLLQQGRPEEALQVLQAMSYLNVASGESYVYVYNIARALEQTGDPRAALKLYAESLLTQPGFAPAIDGAFRVSWKAGPQGLDIIVGLAQGLIERGQGELVMPRLRESLKVWATDPQLQRLLAELVRCYAILSVEPPAFETNEWPAMVPLLDGPFRLPVQEIRLAFVGSLRPAFYYAYEPGPVRSWTEAPWKAQPYSLLMRQLGDEYRRRHKLDDALARYALAWSLNPGDVQAAVLAADLLQEEAQTVDPDGRLLNQFIDKLFESKVRAYVSEDWLNILRLHTLLGTIYARQGKWGSSGNPRGALFQFEHALQAQERNRAKNPKFPDSPGLNAQLADVYIHLGRRADAGRQYFAAAEAYIKERRQKEAREILYRLKPIAVDLSPAEQERYDGLVVRVQGIDTGAV